MRQAAGPEPDNGSGRKNPGTVLPNAYLFTVSRTAAQPSLETQHEKTGRR